MAGETHISNMLHQFERFIRAFNQHDLTKGEQSILESFLRTATLKDVTNVSMRRIGAELGIKLPSIYSHSP